MLKYVRAPTPARKLSAPTSKLRKRIVRRFAAIGRSFTRRSGCKFLLLKTESFGGRKPPAAMLWLRRALIMLAPYFLLSSIILSPSFLATAIADWGL
jgi:hypothetical protein